MKNIIVVVGGGQYVMPFIEHGNVVDFSRDLDWEEVKLVVFTGGADVDPALYEHECHPATGYNRQRDTQDIEAWLYAQRHDIPRVGICRGSQFLTVMNGGKLIQHLHGHGIQGTHAITTKDGREVLVTSTHHQMMYPWDVRPLDWELVAWAEAIGRHDDDVYMLDGGYFHEHEPEAVFYRPTRSLCVQFHPEYMGQDTDGWKYFQELLKEYVL